MRSAKRKLQKEKSFGRTKKREYSDVSLRRGKRKPPKKSLSENKEKENENRFLGTWEKNRCCFLSSWKNTREKFSTGCKGFLFVPVVPDSKKTKQMMKIKHPRVFFQNRGQRGQIRRLLFVPKMPVFPLFTGFPAFFFCVFKQGTAGTKKGRRGQKSVPFPPLSLPLHPSFAYFHCPVYLSRGL